MFKTAALGLCLASALFASVSQAAEEPLIIKFSHVVTEDTPKGRGALLFQKLVNQQLAGRVRVEVYPDSSLFNDAEEIDALMRNEVQLLAPTLSNLSQYNAELKVFDLPFLFDDLAAVERFQRRRPSQQMLSSMVNQGIVGLSYWNNGMKQLSANRPLRNPQDAKGLAFRIQQSPVLEGQFAAVGAKGVNIPFTQSYQAVKNGQIQGAENPWSNLSSHKFHTLQPYITESNHGVMSYMFITNATFWNALPFELRSELQAIADKVTQAVNAEAQAINARERERIVAAGTSRLITLNQAQRDAWREAMTPLYQQVEKEVGAEMIRAALIVNR